MAAALLAAQAVRSTWDGVYTEDQARRGEALYAERCASCHAPDLAGLDQAPALTGADFGADWNGLSLNDLLERSVATMPADKPGSLERRQAADVLASILQRNGFPIGEQDLPAAAEILRRITYAAKRP